MLFASGWMPVSRENANIVGLSCRLFWTVVILIIGGMSSLVLVEDAKTVSIWNTYIAFMRHRARMTASTMSEVTPPQTWLTSLSPPNLHKLPKGNRLAALITLDMTTV